MKINLLCILTPPLKMILEVSLDAEMLYLSHLFWN